MKHKSKFALKRELEMSRDGHKGGEERILAIKYSEYMLSRISSWFFHFAAFASVVRHFNCTPNIVPTKSRQ